MNATTTKILHFKNVNKDNIWQNITRNIRYGLSLNRQIPKSSSFELDLISLLLRFRWIDELSLDVVRSDVADLKPDIHCYGV